MTDTNSTPTPPGDSASGGHTLASQQPVPLQPTQPAPYSAQGTQPYGGQQAYAGHAGYGAQQPYGLRSPAGARLRAAFRQPALWPANLRGRARVDACPARGSQGQRRQDLPHRLRRRARGLCTRLRRVGHYECDDSGQFWLGYFNGRHRPLHRRDDGHRAQRGSDAGRGRVREVLALCGRHHGVRRGFPE